MEKRRRGSAPAEELKRNEKERAEHVRLVDLGPPIWRFLRVGSSRSDLHGDRRYSHVMLLVSIVKANGRFEATARCDGGFPGNCVGAPKGLSQGDHPGEASAAASMPRAWDT